MLIKNYEGVKEEFTLTVLIKGPRHGEFFLVNIVKTSEVRGFQLLLPLEALSFQALKEDYLLGNITSFDFTSNGYFSYETYNVDTLETALDFINSDYDTSLNMYTSVLTSLDFPTAASKIINESTRRFVFYLGS